MCARNSLEKSSRYGQKSLLRRLTTIDATFDNFMSGRRTLTLMGSLRVVLGAERYATNGHPRGLTIVHVDSGLLICSNQTNAQRIGSRVRRSAWSRRHTDIQTRLNDNELDRILTHHEHMEQHRLRLFLGHPGLLAMTLSGMILVGRVASSLTKGSTLSFVLRISFAGRQGRDLRVARILMGT